MDERTVRIETLLAWSHKHTLDSNQLRYLFATQPEVMIKVLSIVNQVAQGDHAHDHAAGIRLPRKGRYLEKAGYLERNVESAYLNLQTDDEAAMTAIVGAYFSYLLATSPRHNRSISSKS